MDGNYTNISSYDYYVQTDIPINFTTISVENETFSSTKQPYSIPSDPTDSPPIYDWNNNPYPSGYSQIHIIVTSFFVTLIMIIIVVGNMLVCIAIATEKSLKTVQNWFIASLAVSDFLVGLVIMPFSLANELMGYWIFGPLWCDIHSALDVFLCTASINNLCLISLDRYWSITQAVEYLKKRTAKRALAMICFVWLLSALISLPPLLGWKKFDDPPDYPTCTVSGEIGYVLYSALGSFYIPAIVMVFVYIRIFIAARSRARRHVKKARHAPEITNDPTGRDKSTTTTTTCTSFSNPSPPDKYREIEFQCSPKKRKLNGTSIKEESPPPTPPHTPQIVIESSKDSPDRFLPGPSSLPCMVEVLEENDNMDENRSDWRQMTDSDECTSPPFRKTKHSSLKDPLPRSSLLSAPKFMKTQFGSTLSLADFDKPDSKRQRILNTRKRRKGGKVKCQSLPVRHVPSDAERQKRKLAKARERRATLILGLIMAAFILAWLPFFVLYVVKAVYRADSIDEIGFAIAFWLGYCNSALNPIIYTIFNRDFRRAFRKILFK
ncbi:alpha-2Da adrenergic receptor-like [Centruroides sculpturatus]|uniref:alpha-2Da adrenergic receptor-like n=1 Tax=Centruroides sculpturatus TaxID=218467 RepID=UPI000C6CBDBB|nr:alpha-2Da adrenergic receptor-like [Centruroides sculpturatus]XP_023216970.1 alpha-2Da adrenergic receptor-like [Centruroides sculpturatus]XP_023216971.1 alpha-2Da adrenergic receptor-like [Centruroides sculpturatus]